MRRTLRLHPAALALLACSAAATVRSAVAQAPRAPAAPPPVAVASWRLVEDLRYDPDGAAELAGPGLVTISRIGEVILGDFRNSRLVVFDARGRFVRTIGRKGQGPGEFEGIDGLGWLGDTLWVTDARLRRVTFLGPDLKHLRTVNDQIRIGRLGGNPPVAMLRGGAAYGTPPVSSGTERAGVNPDSIPVVYRAPGDTTLRPVAWVPHRNTMTTVPIGTGTGANAMAIAFGQPFARYPLVLARPDGRGIVVVTMPEVRGGTTGRVQLVAFGAGGAPAWRQGWPYPAEPVTDAQFDSVTDGFVGRMLPPGRATPPGFDPKKIRDAIYRPPSWAPFTRGFVGADDRLWLIERPRGPGQRYLIFGAGDTSAGEVQGPAGVQMAFATATHAYGFIEVDDEPVLVRYRLEPERGGSAAARGGR